MAALEALGYELRTSADSRANSAHRFTRGADAVDVVVADHAAPSVLSSLGGHNMVQVEGGTQALRRTVHAVLEITPGRRTTVSVPSAFGALILKAAAYRSDTRNRERHLADAVTLLACVDDPFADRAVMVGSDRSRLQLLKEQLLGGRSDNPAWHQLSAPDRRNAQAALRLLCQLGSA